MRGQAREIHCGPAEMLGRVQSYRPTEHRAVKEKQILDFKH
jgi:hypothetical protein